MLKFSLNFLNKNKSASQKPELGSRSVPAENQVTSQYVQSQASASQSVNQYRNNQVQARGLNEHQAVLNHFKLLLQSGHNQEVIQAQWQRYYAQLSEEEKRSIWQKVADSPSKPPNQAAVSQSALGATAQDNQNETVAEKSKTRSFSNFLGIPLAIKGYKSWLSPKFSKNQKAPALNTLSQPQVAANSEGQDASASAKPSIAEMLPDKSLNYKTRNMFTWNSPTALFDKDESKSIWRQNIKSIIFGLTVGAILLVVWQFSFFNEQYVQPFTQPSSLNTEAQIIIAPGKGEVSDPAFKIIIPNISLEAPIVSGTVGFRTVDANESEDAFEERVQKALEKGTVHYPNTQLPGESGLNFNSNFVVLGHSASNYWSPGSYKSVFSKLKDLELGSLILVNYKHQQYIYKIYGKQVIKPTEIDVLQPGDYNNTLTLITCHPPGSSRNRLVISAIQINPDPANNRNVKENAAAGERESILPGKTQTLFDTWRR